MGITNEIKGLINELQTEIQFLESKISLLSMTIDVNVPPKQSRQQLKTTTKSTKPIDLKETLLRRQEKRIAYLERENRELKLQLQRAILSGYGETDE